MQQVFRNPRALNFIAFVQVPGWPALPESVADCGGRLLAEFDSMFTCTRAAKGDLNSDTFIQAASAIFKIQSSRDLQSFVQGVKDCAWLRW